MSFVRKVSRKETVLKRLCHNFAVMMILKFMRTERFLARARPDLHSLAPELLLLELAGSKLWEIGSNNSGGP